MTQSSNPKTLQKRRLRERQKQELQKTQYYWNPVRFTLLYGKDSNNDIIGYAPTPYGPVTPPIVPTLASQRFQNEAGIDPCSVQDFLKEKCVSGDFHIVGDDGEVGEIGNWTSEPAEKFLCSLWPIEVIFVDWTQRAPALPEDAPKIKYIPGCEEPPEAHNQMITWLAEQQVIKRTESLFATFYAYLQTKDGAKLYSHILTEEAGQPGLSGWVERWGPGKYLQWAKNCSENGVSDWERRLRKAFYIWRNYPGQPNYVRFCSPSDLKIIDAYFCFMSMYISLFESVHYIYEYE
jgi:hypothetical protein